MPARIPQDVDLEDRLVFNLTTIQFGYLVLGALGAGIVWKLPWGPAPLRLLAALPLLLGGAALAWGRWHGRPLDAWAVDAAFFFRHNLRFRLRASTAGARRRARMRRGTHTPRAWRRHRRHPSHPQRPPALPPHRE